MLLARVLAKVVCPREDPRLRGKQLKLVEILGAGLEPRDEYFVAVDPLGVALGQLVFTASGASARRVEGFQGVPVDLAVIGVVERISGDPAISYEE
ncbi:MAG: propanediol utilization microcompartment protein PduN [Thermoleophilia bacterium]